MTKVFVIRPTLLSSLLSFPQKFLGSYNAKCIVESLARTYVEVFKCEIMIVRIIFTLFVFCSLLRADDTFALAPVALTQTSAPDLVLEDWK